MGQAEDQVLFWKNDHETHFGQQGISDLYFIYEQPLLIT